MNSDNEMRKQLVNILTVRQAHMDFEDAVADFPVEHINTRPPDCDYTFWHLLEHMRIAQEDILDYITAEEYEWPSFPDDYWPDKSIETDFDGWLKTIEAFTTDRLKLVDVIHNTDNNLYAPLPNSGEQKHNILREINIVASHNSYHTGELGILRQTLGLWSSKI